MILTMGSLVKFRFLNIGKIGQDSKASFYLCLRVGGSRLSIPLAVKTAAIAAILIQNNQPTQPVNGGGQLKDAKPDKVSFWRRRYPLYSILVDKK